MRVFNGITGNNLVDIAHQHLNKPLLSLSGPPIALKRLSDYWNINKLI